MEELKPEQKPERAVRSLASRDTVTVRALRERLRVGYKGRTHGMDKAMQLALEDAGHAVAASRGTATVTMTFTLKSLSFGVIETSGKVSAKLPERASVAIEIYHDKKGTLLEDDPDQGKLGEMKPLDEEDAE